ncbi:MAG: site-2 protease family protein, partial [Ruthenibacterium sp.]
ITINLGVFNLLPVPALDGGRLLFLIIEAVRHKPVPQKFEIGVNAVGFVLLMGLMLFVTFNDITKLF